MQSSAEGVEPQSETETNAHTYWRRETGEIDMGESKRHTLTFILEERQER